MIDTDRLARTIQRTSGVQGVAPPGIWQATVESGLVSRQMRLWYLSVEAVFRENANMFTDAKIDIKKTVSSIYTQYGAINETAAYLHRSYDAGQKFHRAQFLASIQWAMGIGVESLLNDSKIKPLVRKRTFESVRLIKSLDKEMVEDLASHIWDRLEAGDNAPNIKAFVLKRSNVPRYRASVIAIDQTQKFFSNLAEVRQQQVGIVKYRWRDSSDSNVRDTHHALDGQIFYWSKPPSVGHPGEPILCRCVAEPIIPK